MLIAHKKRLFVLHSLFSCKSFSIICGSFSRNMMWDKYETGIVGNDQLLYWPSCTFAHLNSAKLLVPTSLIFAYQKL